jgi:alpha-D-ribose 1-methylphosphonate 5-triphosphate synthase subunit PhnH
MRRPSTEGVVVTSITSALEVRAGGDDGGCHAAELLEVLDELLDQFALGDVRYPERSTTVIFTCDDLTSGAPIALTGPGVEARLTIRPSGLPGDFLAMAQANHEMFPRGVDILLVAGSQMVGLPRSTKLELEAH